MIETNLVSYQPSGLFGKRQKARDFVRNYGGFENLKITDSKPTPLSA